MRGLGVSETEVQGLEGIHAPSQSARIWQKARGLGAKETERQGLERMHAPSQMRGDGEWHQTWCKLLIEESFLVLDVHVGRELIFIISRNHEQIYHPK